MTEPRFGRLLTAMNLLRSPPRVSSIYRAPQDLALRLLDSGTEALLVCGTTGESPTVFYDDKLRLFEAVIEAVNGAAPVIANAGDNCTDDSVAFAQKVVKLGVDAVMAVVPYYNKPPQEGLYRHFGAIASAVDVPRDPLQHPGALGGEPRGCNHASAGGGLREHRRGQGGILQPHADRDDHRRLAVGLRGTLGQ